jgi:hypothetical protein
LPRSFRSQSFPVARSRSCDDGTDLVDPEPGWYALLFSPNAGSRQTAVAASAQPWPKATCELSVFANPTLLEILKGILWRPRAEQGQVFGGYSPPVYEMGQLGHFRHFG